MKWWKATGVLAAAGAVFLGVPTAVADGFVGVSGTKTISTGPAKFHGTWRIGSVESETNGLIGKYWLYRNDGSVPVVRGVVRQLTANKVRFTDLKGTLRCLGTRRVGVYRVKSLAGSKFRLVVVNDPCNRRKAVFTTGVFQSYGAAG